MSDYTLPIFVPGTATACQPPRTQFLRLLCFLCFLWPIANLY